MVWDAFVHLFGDPPNRSLQTRRGRNVNNVAEAIGPDARSSPDVFAEIIRRAQMWPLHFEDATLTEEALAKHWVTLGRAPLRASKSQIRDIELQRDRQARLAAAAEMDQQAIEGGRR
jgi:hypothetical protein